MVLRILTVAGGIAGAAALSQFPEYSQQYTQRLGGAVDELSRVVADFDTSAQAAGLSRDKALELMTGSDFVTRRRVDMERSIARHQRLAADLAALDGAGPFMRAYHLGHIRDGDIAARAWQAYQPALPLTLEGGIFAGAGFFSGFGLLAGLLALLRAPFRRRP
ncbi:hypothetical protein TG4357_01041 [Thalassovita gelatinovora]|uniref:DUF2937 family protein n=1 Tax=Thalassovita gelatinovora TaxID=53501 RepID=A0A0P1F7X2_THAGE|nr:DUF2937 family protein [Thalassovita gelatinovora]QIZ80209.1 DUF2937 family protein [Thalassovita gelatinovora]CUH64054.1 hypothetical protein TG4357_01041 [Thalassovita gelatinovora]SEQ82407.1 Protein of unknown function [Thalassovita gelatinovora]